MTRLAIRARLLAALTILLSLAVAAAAGAQTIGGVPAPVLFSKSDPYPSTSVALDFLGTLTGGQPYFKASGTKTSVFANLPGLTVSRASVGYAANADGSLVLFQPNQARITNQGVLVEEIRTNLFLQSQDAATTWSRGNATIGATTTAPDGTASAKLVVPSAAAGQHSIQQTVTTTAATYTLSAYVKPGGYSKVGFQDVTFSSSYATFSLSGAGSVLATGGSATATINCSTATGFCRISITWTAGAVASTLPFYVLDNAYTTGAPATYSSTGDGTSGVYFWGMEADLGAFALSLIPTTTATATRPSEGINLPVAAQAQGTLVVKWLDTLANPTRGFVSLSDQTLNNFIEVLGGASSGAFDGIVETGGVQQFRVTSGGSLAVGAKAAAVISWSAAGVNYANSVGATNTNGAISVPNYKTLTVGGRGGAGLAQISTYIRGIFVYPTFLSTTQALALATP